MSKSKKKLKQTVPDTVAEKSPTSKPADLTSSNSNLMVIDRADSLNILKYLQTKPYVEVVDLINGLTRNAKMPVNLVEGEPT